MNKKTLKKFNNRYAITGALFLVLIIFFDPASVPQWIKQIADNKKIRNEIKLIDQKALETEKQIRVFKTSKDSIEQYARENYFMKRDNEVIYTID